MKLLMLVLYTAAVFGQPADTFEVASVKLGDAMSPGTMYSYQPGGGLKVENASLRSLVQYAYDLRDFQLSGASGWMTTERYSILAKGVFDAGPTAYRSMSEAQRRAMTALVRKRLQNLLAERFHLVVHRETKELPTYALVIAKAGVKMPPNNTPDGDQGVSTGPTMFKTTHASLRTITQSLAIVTGRPVHDETGLTGSYDVNLKWAPEVSASPDDPDKHPDTAGPTLFTAIQEQLGLKLESKKGPVEIVVIDSAARPSEN